MKTSPGRMSPPNRSRTAATTPSREPRWMGICSAWAMTRPRASNRAVEQSRRSLMLGEKALRMRVWPMFSAIDSKALPMTSKVMESMGSRGGPASRVGGATAAVTSQADVNYAQGVHLQGRSRRHHGGGGGLLDDGGARQDGAGRQLPPVVYGRVNGFLPVKGDGPAAGGLRLRARECCRRRCLRGEGPTAAIL